MGGINPSTLLWSDNNRILSLAILPTAERRINPARSYTGLTDQIDGYYSLRAARALGRPHDPGIVVATHRRGDPVADRLGFDRG